MTRQVPTLLGRIDRRLLINFRAEPNVVAGILPDPFQPQLVDGCSIVGICLIRLAQARPAPLPAVLGATAEQVAHRIAVLPPDGTPGVFIPRRDTSSLLVARVGSLFFSGGLHRARFTAVERDGHYRVELSSEDHRADLLVDGIVADRLPSTSLFTDLEASSAFFERGAVGYSPGARIGCFDGVHVRTARWDVRPLAIRSVRSAFFDDRTLFPTGSVEFDHALIMTNVESRWTALPSIADRTKSMAAA